MQLKDMLIKSLSLGAHDQLSHGKRFALQVAVMDGYWSFVSFFFYVLFTYENNQFPLFYYHLFNCTMMVVGLWLIYKRHYDLGRPLIHLCGLFGIYYCNDVFGLNSGFEYYYFVSILMPHITFSLDEHWKGIALSTIACCVLVFQQIYGTGLLLDPLPVAPEEKLIAIVFVVLFTLTILSVARWRLYQAQEEIRRQQNELIHSSNMIALGEMAAGIAHEINNPLQSLSLQMKVLEEKYQKPDVGEYFDKMHVLINKIARMIQGLKHLSRKEDDNQFESFIFSRILEDVLTISANRIKEAGIQVYVNGDTELKSIGNSIQISQVLINLLNNSIDAISGLPERWIKINIVLKSSVVELSVVDSGNGIPKNISEKMMLPFFTTKESDKGTGLGLSISKSIAEKNRGRLYFDSSSSNTRFVLLLPLADTFTTE